MFSPTSHIADHELPLDRLDRVVIGYLALPLAIFVATWFELWIAVPLVLCVAYSLRSLMSPLPTGEGRQTITGLQVTVAILIGCGWSVFGGTDHIFFANADWHTRDAVLHDLVSSRWPVGYGLLDGRETILRAPLGFYLPAALIGKWSGLPVAHAALGVWTAIGATLFLMQVLSLLPSRLGLAILACVVVVMFSGLDVVGSLLNNGPRFRSDWNVTTHLEWWAGKYQYSSLTTALFWVPNHALGGWLIVGMLCRNLRSYAAAAMFPMTLVALSLWSPLTAIGAVPFLVWRLLGEAHRDQFRRLLSPDVWAPPLVVGVVVGAYLIMDSGRIPRGLSAGGARGDLGMDLAQQAQFFLLEAGIVGAAIMTIRRSAHTTIALVVLALLPLVSFGPGNDLVMRASIPSLAMLAVAAAMALCQPAEDKRALRKKLLLAVVLLIGAVTPAAEFARAALLKDWPINLDATLIGTSCGQFAPHYTARLNETWLVHLMRPPSEIPSGPQGPIACDNPARDLMWSYGMPPPRKLRRSAAVTPESSNP